MGLLQMTFALSFAFARWLGTGALEAFGPRLLWVAACGAALVSAAAMAWGASSGSTQSANNVDTGFEAQDIAREMAIATSQT